MLLDALGTLLRLEPPAPRLSRQLGLGEADSERAVAAEMRYYRAHLNEGRDAASLADLRGRCAQVLREQLPQPAPDLDVVLHALLESLRFTPFDDVRPALGGLRAQGMRLVVVSNWDFSLHDVLARAGLGRLVDAVVTSAEVGARKPSPEIFHRALAVAGVGPSEALHVGDTVDEDVLGARSAGIEAVLVVRDGPPPREMRTIADLSELLTSLPA